jgi:hypothetical protein
MLQNVHTYGNHSLTLEAIIVYESFIYRLRQTGTNRFRKTATLVMCLGFKRHFA